MPFLRTLASGAPDRPYTLPDARRLTLATFPLMRLTMATVDAIDASSTSPAERKSTAWPFFRLAGGFWNGDTSRRAWLLTIGVFVFVFANLGAALAVNRWNKYF